MMRSARHGGARYAQFTLAAVASGPGDGPMTMFLQRITSQGNKSFVGRHPDFGSRLFAADVRRIVAAIKCNCDGRRIVYR